MRLSFCIATMNRADVIGETLASIASQFRPGVEVVIVDGSRDDATEREVQRFAARLPALRYERRAPAGVDRDYSRAVELSAGEYCWLFTDDDVLVSGAIAAVWAALEREPDCVIVNAEVRDATLSRLLEPTRLEVTADSVYPPSEFQAFARTVLNYVSFIGGVVLRRRVWDARAKEKYFGTEFVHVGVLFERPLEGAAVVLSRPWIQIRYGVALWTRRAFRVWMVNWPQLLWSLAGLEPAARATAVPARWPSIRQVFWHRALGGYSRQEYRAAFAAADIPRGRKLGYLLLTVIPMRLANWIGEFHVRWRRPQARALLLDLQRARAQSR